MNNDQITKSFSLRFSDKLTWNEFKDDLKVLLRENEIKFQYSEKTPQFYVLYKSNQIEIRVTWEEDTLLVTLLAEKNLDANQMVVCHEIYDLLILFTGQLEKGKSPYEWEGD